VNADRNRRDAGFTLVELVIAVALMSLLASVISAAVVVTLRNSPAVADRADAAVNVQGLVTWLPQDVDSAKPGTFDTSQGVSSGCAGTDPGFNVFKVTWSETISSTVDYGASYRYVAVPNGGYIVRVSCVIGQMPSVLKVTGVIPPWVAGSEPVKIVLTDSVVDADALVDSAKFMVTPLVGKTIVIDATTKNPNETLTTVPPPPPPPPPPPTPNQPPTAADTAATIQSGTAVTIGLAATDPEGGALTVSIAAVPVGWAITPGPGSLVVTAPVTAEGTTETLSYTVSDPLGASASAQLAVSVTAPAPNQPPLANPATVSTGAGESVTIGLPASDPEGGALTTTFGSVPVGWTATAIGLAATITPANDATTGNLTFDYTVTDGGGLTSTSTITVTITAPPPCVINTPVLSESTVALKKNDPDALTKSVDVTITIVSGYCVGLALHYDTGAPNGQYVRNFGTSGTTRTVTLPNHPSPELWSAGTKALDVRDGSATVIGTVNLQVTP
jgi:prepilin-type N-terminal cleavage/methylation domain-containing protein